MRIGVVPPIPMEVFISSPHEVENLWARFFLADDRSEWEEAALDAGVPEDLPLWPKCLSGMLLKDGLDAVWYPEPVVAPDVRKCLKYIGESGIEVHAFHFPALRNIHRLHEEIARTMEALNVTEDALRDSMDRWSPIRVSLRRFDGLQHRTQCFSSSVYVETLANAMNPGSDLDQARRFVELQVINFQGSARDGWIRLGFAGLTPYRRQLFRVLKESRGVVVYDEWGLENNPMGTSPDVGSLYHHCSLPYGLKKRSERLTKEIKERKLQGILLSVERLADHVRDEAFFRAALPIPVLLYENDRALPMDDSEIIGIRRFLSQCMEAH